MKNILKKNQIAIFIIAIIFVMVGYLNYNSKISKEVSSNEINNVGNYAGIGDAKLVDSEAIVGEENTIVNNITNQSNQSENNVSVETSSKTSEGNYFTTSKIDRDNMYSQMLETYQKILDDSNISQEQKTISTQEITKINNTKNAIMIAENLIKTKGFEDVVIFVNDTSVNCIVKGDTLNQQQTAQLQNIISRELNVDITNIHISTK